MCNGEIYNWKELESYADVQCNSGSDCEIIIHLYKKYGIKQTLQMIDGVFAFVLWDKTTNDVYAARDPFGIRPMFVWMRESDMQSPIIFASDVKTGQNILTNVKPRHFPPGHFIKFHAISLNIKLTQEEYYKHAKNIIDLKHMYTPYHSITSFKDSTIKTIEDTVPLIRNSLIEAVKKRVTNTDRDIACLLSGGLDSSLICALVAKEYVSKYGPNGAKKLHTWSIGLEGSEDLIYAEKVAKFIGTTHHEIKLDESEFLNAIPQVIHDIESNDITTIRASVGNWLISKYIKENSESKVIFNGDGSDEVTGGYLYFHYAPDPISFDQECRRLLKDIHYFDVLRSDRCISSHGLEARTPFLDRCFVEKYLSIPMELRDHKHNIQCEKFLLRNAFSDMYILPEAVLWRMKEAFSDGVSKSTKSWFEIIQDFASKKTGIKDGKLAEQSYYDSIFNKKFALGKNLIPYKWMPKFIDATDSSARTLSIYKFSQIENEVSKN
jgi:asparagine synthase (glutamine-hydrolysing)